MRWRRVLFVILGFVMTVSLSCSAAEPPQSSTAPDPVSDSAPNAAIAARSSDVAEPNATADSLPPETEAIVSAQPDLVNPPRGDVRLAVISDLNGPYGSTDYDPDVDKAMRLLPFWNPDMVLCSGDMVAGQDPSLSPEQIQQMWAAFDDHVAAPLRAMGFPYGFTIGNHDASGARGIGDAFLFQRERDLARAYWDDPAHDPGLTFSDRYDFPFYYSFTYNDIFFVAWDGSSSSIPANQLAWVEQTLASPEAQQARMRVLLGHLPLYAVAIGRNQPAEVMDNADALREMLERYNVHTYISGHHHAYYPAHRGNLQLLHTGILGSGPRPLIDSNLPPWKALTVIDVNFDTPELTTYTTYDLQSLAEIEYEQLPRLLMGHNGMVVRRDIPWDALTAQEKSTCEQRLGAVLCEP
jgi:hypothetical protein